MNALFELIAQTPVADYMRGSRWGYAAASTAHVLGISLIVGAIVPLDLRLLGMWKRAPLEPLTHVLPQVAMAGLCLAVITGFFLFSVRPAEYAANPAFQIKLFFVALGTGIALGAQWAGILKREQGPARTLLGAASLGCWVAALICGRLIAFTGT
ncbi:hypothetical protein [Henriciella aquimarina]|uniref:hypothetical protein n=1 Tax=Henriciella aquimarina TaxID=545261 RepID=UPI000A0377FC|nr:hypothetical protein [Henriciella aquimarina]